MKVFILRFRIYELAMFAVLLSLLLGLYACGNSETVSLNYKVPASTTGPELIVVLHANSDLTTWTQNVRFVVEGSNEELSFFKGQEANIAGCAAYLQMVERKTGLFPTAPTVDFCNGASGLANYFRNSIFGDAGITQLGTDPLSTSSTKLDSRSSGYVFVLFFYNATKAPSTSRCFQMAAYEIENGNLIEYNQTSNTRTPKAETTFNLASIPSTSCFEN